MKKEEPQITINELARMVAKGFLDMQHHFDQRLSKIEKRLDKIEERLDKIEVRLNRVEMRLNIVEQRLDRLERELEEINLKLDRLDKRTNEDDQALFSDIDWLRKRVLRLERDVKVLKAKQL